MSSTEAEVYSLADAVAEAVHMGNIAEELGLKRGVTNAPVHCDSQGAIGYQQNGGNGKSRMKHIDLRSAWIEEMRNKKVDVLYVGTADNHADTFTKLLNYKQLDSWMKANMASIED